MRVGQLTSRIHRLAEGKFFFLLLIVILLGGLVLRTIYLDADPPIGITNSQDFSTDPFSYVYFAKNKIDTGNANPYNDQRWILYEKSTQTLAALIVYSIFGTGRAAGNLVGVLLNFAAILMLALAIKNFGSRLGALLFAFLASLNYTLVHFARAPFMEASENFWLCAAFYFLSLGQNRAWVLIFAGMAAAAAALFGKMIALFAIGLYIAAFVLYWLSDRKQLRLVVKQALFFLAGYAAVAIFWLLFTYLPSSEQVAHYLSEQGVGLYGAPKAFDGIGMFFFQLQTLLVERHFFAKLPLITIFGSLFGAGVIYSLLRGRRHGTGSGLNMGWLVLLLWVAASFVSLFPFNYRPLRYETTLMFPMMAMAGLMLAAFLSPAKPGTAKGKGKHSQVHPVYLGILWGLWLMPMLYAVLVVGTGMWGNPASRANLTNSPLLYALLLFLVGFGSAFLVKAARGMRFNWRPAALLVAVVLLVGYAAVQFVEYGSWVRMREYTLVTADRDMGAILAKDAVISGSYAVALTQENDLGAVHHMFGLKYVDPDFFKRFPITHLVVDEGNEKRAREDYPDVMSNSEVLATYGIRGYSVKLIRVAGATGNEQASEYQPTAFEDARHWVDQASNDSARVYFERYLDEDIPNYSADMALGTAYMGESNYAKALVHLRKAHDFAPRDVLANYYLGYAYMGVAAAQTEPAYFDSALACFKFAHLFMPKDQKLTEAVKELEQRKR
jgi:hypothetical protein